MSKTLILSGGGAKGAFTVGALKVWKQRHGTLDFDIISGTSTGSLIASLLVGDRLDLLERIYLTVDNNSIVNSQNIIANIRNDLPFLMSDAPLSSIIQRELTQEVADVVLQSRVTLLLTAVSLQTGRITVFSNHVITPPAGSRYNFVQLKNRKELLDALSASSNQFAFLPPVSMKVGGLKAEQMVDGGVRDTIPTRAVFAIAPDPDEIVVMSNNPMELFQQPNTYTSPIDVLMRGISIFIQDVRENDMQVLDDWADDTGKDYILIKPDSDLDEAYPTGLRFEPQRMARMMVQGERTATRILDALVSDGTLEVASAEDGAIILARPGKPEPAPTTNTSSRTTRCKGRTEQGKRCKNRVAGTEEFCHLHR